jgi:hypothetical protein
MRPISRPSRMIADGHEIAANEAGSPARGSPGDRQLTSRGCAACRGGSEGPGPRSPAAVRPDELPADRQVGPPPSVARIARRATEGRARSRSRPVEERALARRRRTRSPGARPRHSASRDRGSAARMPAARSGRRPSSDAASRSEGRRRSA